MRKLTGKLERFDLEDMIKNKHIVLCNLETGEFLNICKPETSSKGLNKCSIGFMHDDETKRLKQVTFDVEYDETKFVPLVMNQWFDPNDIFMLTTTYLYQKDDTDILLEHIKNKLTEDTKTYKSRNTTDDFDCYHNSVFYRVNSICELDLDINISYHVEPYVEYS